jgi:TusA-related sulfurtransferase
MTVRHRLDLVGIPCPLSWAKAKVFLEDVARGDLVELVLDDPRGARDLPRAAEAEGHHVVALSEERGCWVILLEK